MNRTKLIILIIAALVIAGAAVYLREYLTLANVKSQLDSFEASRAENPVTSALIYLTAYILATAVSVPGAVLFSLAGGALFGFWFGTLLAIISATIGATLAFLLARYLFEDMVRARMGSGGKLETIREKFKQEGVLYLFSLRLAPIFPFFAINLLMSLTSIRVSSYMIASFIGMLPGCMVYVNAGTQLAKIDTLQGLLSPELIISFILIALFPYAAKYVVQRIRRRAAR